MIKPNPTRKADVLSKIDYANSRYQDLMNELFEAKKHDRDPTNLVHAAAEVIATARECFDYLGKDIVESFVIPFTQNTEIKKYYAAGKLHVYFPFDESQVKDSRHLFYEVKHSNPSLYADLVSFTESVTKKLTIPNTLFEYALFTDIKNMVNEKKHDKLNAIINEQSQELLIEKSSFKMIIPVKKQVGLKTVAVSPGTVIKRVAEYRFAYNNKEVGDFCLFAVKATSLVVVRFYTDYFA